MIVSLIWVLVIILFTILFIGWKLFRWIGPAALAVAIYIILLGSGPFGSGS